MPNRSSRARRSTRSATSRRFERPGIRRIRSSADDAGYYGGFKQQDVKPTPESPLLKLGIEKIPPLVTTAVLLDAKQHVGKGRAMADGELVTAAHIEAMLKAQGLGRRGILPGDMVWIYTGWSENWKDGDDGSPYYAMAPGLSVDAAKCARRPARRCGRPRRAVHRPRTERHAAGQGAAGARHRAGLPFSSITRCCRCSASITSRT